MLLKQARSFRLILSYFLAVLVEVGQRCVQLCAADAVLIEEFLFAETRFVRHANRHDIDIGVREDWRPPAQKRSFFQIQRLDVLLIHGLFNLRKFVFTQSRPNILQRTE